MPRTAGSKNLPKNILYNGEGSYEDIFLGQLIAAKKFWTDAAKKVEENGKDNKRLLEYADAYRKLINVFTNDEPEEEKNEVVAQT